MRGLTLLAMLVCCIVSAKSPLDSIKVPEGINLVKNPEFVRGEENGQFPGWSNYGGKAIAISHAVEEGRNLLKLVTGTPGYHLGLNTKLKLKPATTYTAYILCKAMLKPGAKLTIGYVEMTESPSGKKSSIAAKYKTQSFDWELFQVTFKTPDATQIECEFYPVLITGETEIRILSAGILEQNGKTAGEKTSFSRQPQFKNLLNNPGFAVGGNALPLDWNLNFEFLKDSFRVEKDSEGKNVLAILPVKGTLTLRQGDIQLNPGEKYIVGAMIRTKNLKAQRSGVVIYNFAWGKDVGSGNLPENTDGWKKIETVVTAPDSRMKMYSFAVYTVGNESGEIRVKEPYLIPLDIAAASGAVPAVEASGLNRLTPVDPLLSEINADAAVVFFSFAYPLPKTEEAYECAVRTKMSGENFYSEGKRFAFAGTGIKVDLGRLTPGRGTLKIELSDKSSKKIIASAEYPITAIRPPEGRVEKHLNQLVTRLLTSRNAGDSEYFFFNPRNGWVLIQLSKGVEKTKGYLNDQEKPVLVYRNGEAFETMRSLPAGLHKLRLEGTAGGMLTVNSIPQTFAYTYPAPHLTSYRKLYGEFMFKYIYPVINTFNYGYGLENLPSGAFADVKERGKHWFALGLHLNPAWSREFTNEYEKPEKLAERLKNSPGMKNADMNGVAFDEIEIGDIKDKLIYTQALWRLTEAGNPVYTWSSGVKFSVNGLNADYLSAAVNNGGGRGKFLFECYARTQPTEKQAHEYLEDYLNTSLRQAKKLMPGAAKSSLIVNGVYTKPGDYCTDPFPEVDVKRFWDIYFHKIANENDFEGLFGVGIYSFSNGDEENIRWICRLLRHYAIEGERAMLSDRYGYKYIPGHLLNGDFTEGLKHWQVKSAGDGLIRHENVPGFGFGIQKRNIQPTTIGNDVCVFKRDAGAPNKLSQTMKGFVPGRLYSLRYAVSDFAEVKAGKGTSSEFELNAELNGARIVTDSTPVAKYDEKLQIMPYINRHTIVFEAEKPEIILTFSDWKSDSDAGAATGQELLLNFIQVKPYYRE